ncbi:site-2 protease family protein [Natronomonas salina]|uniref:site-2 protease family protein n=1 Tax=Natronomonas salina TaxID=1710540 RepID=UPI0015B5347C|nr:site-2 protease family protein [Natronomonas salina]QLD90514.1 site-2 protease family protein [Natronomonas salina]
MQSFRVGSAFGIPIKLDLTFLLVLPVFAYVIGLQLGDLVELFDGTLGVTFDVAVLTATETARYGIGTAAALGLFACVVAHEFGHSLVARRYDVPIESITLWLLGGVAQMTEIPEDWRKEFNIAIAGPIVSATLGALAYLALLVVPSGGFTLEVVRFVLAYLAVMNVVLAGFNLLPGFPMDGGRILRALLARSRPHAQATQQAARVGQLFAIVLGIVGVLAGFRILLILLAFFIYIAAASEASRTVMKAALEGVAVGDVMTPSERLDTVTPETSVADLVDRMFRERHTGYPVVQGGRIAGVVTLSDAREVDAVERDAYRVEDVMTRDVVTVTTDTPVMDAFERMQKHDIGRLLVVDEGAGGDDGDGALVGLLSRTDVMTALEIAKTGGAPGERTLTRDATTAGTLGEDRI